MAHDILFHAVVPLTQRLSVLARRAFNKGRRSRDDRIEIDLSHSNLAKGALCCDGQWRQIVTVEDALTGGCNLYDIDQLQLEYSSAEYQNLLMCEFVDDKVRVLPFAELQSCMIDSLEEWENFNPYLPRPFSYRPIWIGYDPSHTSDSAGCAVIAPPLVAGGKFRVLNATSSGALTLPRRQNLSRA